MSKQELLSWTSLGSTTSILVIYLIYMFGWPDLLPDYSARIVKIFINVFWIALVLEIVIGIKESKAKIDKDERDIMVEAFSYKYAYNFIMVVLVLILSHVLLNIMMGSTLQINSISKVTDGVILFHILFFTLLLASGIRRVSMIYFYRKMY
jgi:hypothetical protein